MPKTNISEKDSRPMVQLQSVLEPTDEIRRLDAEIQATLEVERYDERHRQNNDSRPMRHKENAYDRALAPGESIGLEALRTRLRSDLAQDDLPWLYQMVTQLHQEGLVHVNGLDSGVQQENPNKVRMRLP